MKIFTTLCLMLSLLILTNATPPQALKLMKGNPKNVLKMNLIPIAFKTYSFQYEHSFMRNLSLCLQVGYNSEMRLGTYINRILDTVSNDKLNAVRAKFSLTELSTTANTYITPEIRIYLSRKGAPNGFYLAPYYRFTTSKVHATFNYKDSNNVDIPIVFTGNLNSVRPGVMVGYQKSFLKRLVVDFWLGGVQFGSSKASFDATSDFTKVDKEGVVQFVEDNFKYGNATVTIDSDTHAKLEYTGKTNGFRVGLCLGFRF